MGFTGAASTIVNVSSAPAVVTLTTPANLTTKNLYGAVVQGNGADGAVTISGTVVLTRDMQYLSLTVNAGATLITAGWRVFVSGTLTNNGTINNDATTDAGAPYGSLAGGGAGGSAGAPPTAGSTGLAADTFGGAGGRGGNASVNWNGASGGDRQTASALLPVDTSTLATRRVAGGAGGGGGGNGGNGGGGGGVLTLFASIIINNGTISANGAPGQPHATDGAGGGGGGGVVVLLFGVRTGAPAVALGGAAGPGQGPVSPGKPGLVAELII